MTCVRISYLPTTKYMNTHKNPVGKTFMMEITTLGGLKIKGG